MFREFFDDENYAGIESAIDEIAEVLRLIYNGDAAGGVPEKDSLFGKLRKESKELFAEKNAGTSAAERAVRGYLRHFYENFDSYDQIIFPITFETPVGEGDMVEVARISPADAVNLTEGKKLAGDTFFSFSAFFDKNWRRNDIMWGRLDAAERLIEMIAPNEDLLNAPHFKKTVITETQRQILKQNKSFLFGEKNTDKIDYINFIRQEYRVNRELDEDPIMKTSARALAVTANVLRSPTESRSDSGATESNQPDIWLLRVAGLVNSFERLVVISSSRFSITGVLAFLTAPFRMGWLTVAFAIAVVLFFNVWTIIFKILRLLDVWQNFPASETNLYWIGGAIFAFGVFYFLLFGLTYYLKNKFFRWLKKEIVGEEPTA